MKSIELQSSLSPLYYSKPNQRKYIETPKLLLPYCFSINTETLRLSTIHKKQCRFSQTQTKAMDCITSTSCTHFVMTLASARTKSTGEVSAFVLISLVLFIFYWVSNFVVPDIISKNLGIDELDENKDDKKDDV